jgi:hypothetical protein
MIMLMQERQLLGHGLILHYLIQQSAQEVQRVFAVPGKGQWEP